MGDKSFCGSKNIGGIESGYTSGGFEQKGAHKPSPVVRDGMARPPSRSGPPKKGGKVK